MQGLLVFAALLGMSFAAHPDFRPYNVTAELMFQATDLDHDGIMSRTELDKTFAKYDADGNGVVSRHEYTNYLTTDLPTLHDFSHALYDDYDVDGDHHLNKHDFDMYYVKLDADNDGAVSEAEFIAYWEDLFRRTEHLHGHGHGR